MTVLKGAGIALLLGTGSAQAITFDALPTVSDFSGNAITLWFDDLDGVVGNELFTLSETGTVTLEDGVGRMTGTTLQNGSATDGLSFDVSFNDDTPDGASYKNALGRFDGEPSNIELFAITSGSITGFGGWASLVMSVSQYPSPEGAVTQIGGGLPGEGTANQHNENFGLSTWFAIDSYDFDEMSCTLCGGITDALIGTQGDIVLDLAESDTSNVSPVPVPAGIALSLTGLAILGGIGFGRRRA